MTPRLLALQSLRDKLRVATGPLPDETVAEVLYWTDPRADGDDFASSSWVSSGQKVMPDNRCRWSLTRWPDGKVVKLTMPSATVLASLLLAVVEARIAEETS